MAETRKIVIEIKNKGNGIDEKIKEMSPLKEQENKVTSDGLILAKSVLLNQAINTAKRTVINAVTSSVDRYMTLTEDYMAQTSYQNAITTINKMTSLVGSVYAGAKIGSVGGAVGSAVGAGIALVGFGANEIISYQSRMSGYYRQINASNISRAYYSKRYGLIDNGRGTEN